ncbi:hypothetical protein ACFWDQ_15855 [Streptomyces sp. NPDC060053]|uniref:hypothetical protein n=1 Tax=Streptomyces sp. NPDC060053 TaxID=3347047 RepID=UPI0036BE7FD7
MTGALVGVSPHFTGDSHRLPVGAGHASMLTTTALLLTLPVLVLALLLALPSLPVLVLLPVPFVRRLGPRVG